jgi:hypothetical protein
VEGTLARFAIDGTLYVLALTIVVIGSLLYNNRLWMQDYPKEIQLLQAPLTAQEKRERIFMAGVLLVVMLGGPLLSNVGLKAANGGSLSFLSAYLNALVLFNLFNLFDAVVIDWFLGTVVKAQFMLLPGSETRMHLYRDWNMHITNYLKGVIGGFFVALPVALISSIL